MVQSIHAKETLSMNQIMHALAVGTLFLGVAGMVPHAFADKGDGVIEPGEDEIAELARAVQNPLASPGRLCHLF